MNLKRLIDCILNTPSKEGEEKDKTVPPDVIARDQDGNWYEVSDLYMNDEDDIVISLRKTR